MHSPLSHESLPPQPWGQWAKEGRPMTSAQAGMSLSPVARVFDNTLFDTNSFPDSTFSRNHRSDSSSLC